jgi:hypothetical protein
MRFFEAGDPDHGCRALGRLLGTKPLSALA